MNSLEEKLIELKTELNNIKTSQALGGSNYGVLFQQTSITSPLSTNNSNWWVCFQGTSNFPLVNFGFEIYENGELKPEARVAYLSSLGGTSIGSYKMDYCYERYLEMFRPPSVVNATASNVVVVLLTMFGQAGSYGNAQIVVQTKANCEGVLKVESAVLR